MNYHLGCSGIKKTIIRLLVKLLPGNWQKNEEISELLFFFFVIQLQHVINNEATPFPLTDSVHGCTPGNWLEVIDKYSWRFCQDLETSLSSLQYKFPKRTDVEENKNLQETSYC